MLLRYFISKNFSVTFIYNFLFRVAKKHVKRTLRKILHNVDSLDDALQATFQFRQLYGTFVYFAGLYVQVFFAENDDGSKKQQNCPGKQNGGSPQCARLTGNDRIRVKQGKKSGIFGIFQFFTCVGQHLNYKCKDRNARAKANAVFCIAENAGAKEANPADEQMQAGGGKVD